MNGLLKAISLFLLAIYPAVVYFGLKAVPLHYLGIVLVGLALARLFSLRGQAGQMPSQMILVTALIGISAYAILANDPQGFRYYPVVVNAVFLAVFGYSLVRGTPMVERLARITEPDLPTHAVRYTRLVTWVWSVFFLGNGLMAYYTAAHTSIAFWALYNGCLSYLLIATLFSTEWLVRREIRRKWDAAAH